MKPSMHRRHFLHQGTLAIGALCTPLLGAMQAGAAPARSIAQGFIGKYSDQFLIRSEDAGVTRLVALVRDLPSFAEALFRARAAGISDLRVTNTVATFHVGGHAFEVENLLSENFAARNS